MICWSLSYVVKFIAVEHGGYGLLEDCGVSNAEYVVHLVCTNRLHACREFCCVHSWQHEWHKMWEWCKVLWCHSHLVWLVF